ncbi:E3 ubiquitin-protein ligase E3D isoform X3 [Eptesicus fuscus]|uniref:E3 ubiquitin-protein ligase E3D isoform X3 n=1 Tax=Eptesicus fuscus TaxID=29078 RepID=UPI00240467E5|nr:E3 ubiquitin-protein ligase E3D isoform X3 [Eptesicus fuscus]
MAPPAETRVFLEVRSRLQSALLILGEPKEGGMPMDISITPSSLQVKTPGGCTEICLPAEVRLVPSSSRGLQYVAGDGLHLRLQAWVEFSTQLTSMFNQSSEAQDCCTFYCQSCGEVIIRDRKLLRVLPLPTENWGALVGEWCCHPDPFANKPLHPRENDCFIGDSFFLVNLRSDTWQPSPQVAPEETHCLSSENHFKSLWLLNSDSVVIESLASSRSVKKFPLLEDILKADSSSARNAVKVLYQPCIKSRNEKLVSSWESDISVHSLTLPSATCLELLLLLSRNNATLPPSLRCMNSFQQKQWQLRHDQSPKLKIRNNFPTMKVLHMYLEEENSETAKYLWPF